MPTYPPAQTVARTMEQYFSRHAPPDLAAEDAVRLHRDVAAIEAIVDTAFWASLRREEGYVPKISLAFLPPDSTTSSLLFDRPLPLGAAALAKLAPAVERPGIHLGVWRVGDGLSVWGTTREIPTFAFVLEVIDPGLLVVKHRRTDAGKFVNVLVLEGDRIKIVDEGASTQPDCPSVLSSLLGFHAPRARDESINVLVELAVSMRAHGRGGSLLVVPAGSETWQESILQPVAYRVVPSFSALAALLAEDESKRHDRAWQEALDRAIDAVAGLTAVDGATLLTDTYEVMAFGAKISRRDGSTRVNEVVVTEPIEGSVAATVHPAELGGTRHLSAAQFVQDQREAVALVASQDGRFTIFSWSACEEMVHAHRVESLLL